MDNKKDELLNQLETAIVNTYKEYEVPPDSALFDAIVYNFSEMLEDEK